MKKVAIIGTAGVPAKYGGFETLTDQLIDNMSDQFKLSVYCSGKLYKKEERKKYYKGAKLFFLPFNANGVQSILYDIVSILHALFYADTLLILGVSGGILIPFVRLIPGKKVIVNIDGLEWKRPKWNKWVKRFLKFSEYLAVKFSHADITDNEGIKSYTAEHYKSLSILIEYGGDHAKKRALTQDILKKYPFLNRSYAFKVCRIEPENNLHVILTSFEKQQQKNLVIVGNWDNSDYGKSLKLKYEYSKNIHLLDPIYDSSILDAMRSNCYIYIHGHSAGGTNPSLVEAMNLEVPVIAFDCIFNRKTTEDKALFFSNSDHLTELLESTTLSEYISVKQQLYAIAKRRYTWEVISRKYVNLILSFDYNYVKKPIYSQISQLRDELLEKEGLAHLKNPNSIY